MHKLSRMVALGLLLTMAAAFSGVPAMPSVPPGADHRAGCHGHTPPAPFPAPVSYQCCASGHDAALPNPVFALGLTSVVTQFSGLDAGKNAGLDSVISLHSTMFVVPSISPPGAAPLRI